MVIDPQIEEPLSFELENLKYKFAIEEEKGQTLLNIYIQYNDKEDKVIENLDKIFNRLKEFFSFPEPEINIQILEDKDWLYKYKEFFKPIKIRDIFITPPWEKIDSDNKIIINPKMGFGTGHHPTTRLVLENMFDIDFKGKTVIDIGCGSGILGAAAIKLGAKYVAFVEIDPMAIESCEETIELNNIKKEEHKIYNIDIIKDYDKIDLSKFDIALINITYDVITEMFNVVNFRNISYYLISGILKKKEKDITDFFNDKGFIIDKIDYLEDWLFIKVRR